MAIELVTRRLKLRDAFPEKFADICKEHEIDADSEFVMKGLTPDDLKFEENERAVISHITTDTVDRDHEIVSPNGAVLTDYRKNPVVLFGHDHSGGLPIGKNIWIKRDEKGLVAKTVYANHQLANDVYEFQKEGFPLAKSIGFIPLKVTKFDEGSEERKQGTLRRYDKWILLEYSDVPVPSNPDAVALAVSKGLLTEKEADEWMGDIGENETVKLLESAIEEMELPEETENKTEPQIKGDGSERNLGASIEEKKAYECECIKCGWKITTDKHCNEIKCEKCGGEMRRVERPGPGKALDEDDFLKLVPVEKPGWDETETSYRRRVRDPGAFQEGTFRTVPIKRDSPKVNSVMGKLKGETTMKIQSVIFPKAEKWTLAKAKSWLAEHSDLLKNLDDGELKEFAECFYENSESLIQEFLFDYYGFDFSEVIELEETDYEIEIDEEEKAEDSNIIDADFVTSKIKDAFVELKSDLAFSVAKSDLIDEIKRMKGKV